MATQTPAADAGRVHGAAAATAEGRQLWDDAKATVRAVATEKQRSTASDIAEFAKALRNASRSVPEGGPVAQIAARSATTLERVSETLRNKDFDSLVREAQDFARNRPALFLGMAVAAGFLATRFLKSAAPDRVASSASGTPDSSLSHAPVRSSARDEPHADPVAGAASPFPPDPRRT